ESRPEVSAFKASAAQFLQDMKEFMYRELEKMKRELMEYMAMGKEMLKPLLDEAINRMDLPGLRLMITQMANKLDAEQVKELGMRCMAMIPLAQAKQMVESLLTRMPTAELTRALELVVDTLAKQVQAVKGSSVYSAASAAMIEACSAMLAHMPEKELVPLLPKLQARIGVESAEMKALEAQVAGGAATLQEKMKEAKALLATVDLEALRDLVSWLMKSGVADGAAQLRAGLSALMAAIDDPEQLKHAVTQFTTSVMDRVDPAGVGSEVALKDRLAERLGAVLELLNADKIKGMIMPLVDQTGPERLMELVEMVKQSIAGKFAGGSGGSMILLPMLRVTTEGMTTDQIKGAAETLLRLIPANRMHELIEAIAAAVPVQAAQAAALSLVQTLPAAQVQQALAAAVVGRDEQGGDADEDAGAGAVPSSARSTEDRVKAIAATLVDLDPDEVQQLMQPLVAKVLKASGTAQQALQGMLQKLTAADAQQFLAAVLPCLTVGVSAAGRTPSPEEVMQRVKALMAKFDLDAIKAMLMTIPSYLTAEKFASAMDFLRGTGQRMLRGLLETAAGVVDEGQLKEMVAQLLARANSKSQEALAHLAGLIPADRIEEYLLQLVDHSAANEMKQMLTTIVAHLTSAADATTAGLPQTNVMLGSITAAILCQAPIQTEALREALELALAALRTQGQAGAAKAEEVLGLVANYSTRSLEGAASNLTAMLQELDEGALNTILHSLLDQAMENTRSMKAVVSILCQTLQHLELSKVQAVLAPALMASRLNSCPAGGSAAALEAPAQKQLRLMLQLVDAESIKGIVAALPTYFTAERFTEIIEMVKQFINQGSAAHCCDITLAE
ncbi:hypothetical protein CYMTET_25937, partial [Cymbomonas tetramitiformis]